jgi:hypothetical protein
MEDWFGADDLEALDYVPLANAIGANERHELVEAYRAEDRSAARILRAARLAHV